MDRRSFVSGSLGAAFYAALMGDAKAAGTSRAPKLRIREVRAIRLKGGFNPRFVRVYTEEGLTGTGEFVDTMGAEYIINNNFNAILIFLFVSHKKLLFSLLRSVSGTSHRKTTTDRPPFRELLHRIPLAKLRQGLFLMILEIESTRCIPILSTLLICPQDRFHQSFQLSHRAGCRAYLSHHQLTRPHPSHQPFCLVL